MACSNSVNEKGEFSSWSCANVSLGSLMSDRTSVMFVEEGCAVSLSWFKFKLV